MLVTVLPNGAILHLGVNLSTADTTVGRLIFLELVLGSDFDVLPPDQWPARFDVFQADGSTRVDPAEWPVARALRGDVCEPALYLLRHAEVSAGIFMQISARPVRNRR